MYVLNGLIGIKNWYEQLPDRGRFFYLIQSIDDISILQDIFHEDTSLYLPDWNNEQQVNFFYERLNSFLLMKDIKDEQCEK